MHQVVIVDELVTERAALPGLATVEGAAHGLNRCTIVCR
jgi:hypothetical protein